MLKVKDLNKRFGDIHAVNSVTFHVKPGEIYGLLGPNGAGKTTTMKMICGLIKPDSGRIVIGGNDLATEPSKTKKLLGSVPQEIALYEELSARENLRFWGAVQGLKGSDLAKRSRDMLAKVGLLDRAKERVGRYSGGMKRRLNLAVGLLHQPKLLLLDEPTVGIDPQARQNILEIVKEYVSEGTTILYTTHYLEEAQMLCDRVGIIDNGKLLAEGTISELTEIVGESQIIKMQGIFDKAEVQQVISELDGVEISWVDADRVVLSLQSESILPSLLKRVFREDWKVDDVSVKPPSLESVFLKLTGRELRD